jgi:hypothetical protein
MKNAIPTVHSVQQLNAIFQLSQTSLNVKDSMALATQLVIHGFTEPAKAFIAEKKGAYSNRHAINYLDYLCKINFNLSMHQRNKKLDLDDVFFKHLLSPRPTLVKRPNCDRLVIVFATAWNNFGVSFPVLHSILRKCHVSILYIKNNDQGMYCNGYADMGSSIDELAEFLIQFKRDEAYKDVTVLGFSSGGYAALFAASAISADAYIGFGIRTDWAQECQMPRSSKRVAPLPEHYKNNTLINLANYPSISQITKATMYFGDLDKADAAHAANMCSLKNVDIQPIFNSTHNVILSLIAEGRFEQILRAGLARN